MQHEAKVSEFVFLYAVTKIHIFMKHEAKVIEFVILYAATKMHIIKGLSQHRRRLQDMFGSRCNIL